MVRTMYDCLGSYVFLLRVSALFSCKVFCPTWPDAEVPAHRLRICFSQHKKPVHLQAVRHWWHMAYRAHSPACSFLWWLKKTLLTSGHCTLAALLYCQPTKMFDTHHCGSSKYDHTAAACTCTALHHDVLSFGGHNWLHTHSSPFCPSGAVSHCLLSSSTAWRVHPAALHMASRGVDWLLQVLAAFISPLASSAIARLHKATPRCCPTQFLIVISLAATTVKYDRSQDSQAMADRITDEVNSILCQEDGAPQLNKQAVLDLIDQGASQGGPQAGCNKCFNLNCFGFCPFPAL